MLKNKYDQAQDTIPLLNAEDNLVFTPKNANKSVVWTSSNLDVLEIDEKNNKLNIKGPGTSTLRIASKVAPEVYLELTYEFTE